MARVSVEGIRGIDIVIVAAKICFMINFRFLINPTRMNRLKVSCDMWYALWWMSWRITLKKLAADKKSGCGGAQVIKIDSSPFLEHGEDFLAMKLCVCDRKNSTHYWIFINVLHRRKNFFGLADVRNRITFWCHRFLLSYEEHPCCSGSWTVSNIGGFHVWWRGSTIIK